MNGESIKVTNRDVHLWYVQSENARQRGWLTRYFDLMSSEELDRYQRFVFEKDRDQFLITRALLRQTLSRYSSEKPGNWCFQKNEFGKPEIVSDQNPLQLRFNVSHCEGLVLCAVAIGSSVGVDCENINRRVSIEQLAPRVCSTREREFIDSVPGSLRTKTFFRLWTLKEAYIKARGIGMSLSLTECSFDISKPPCISISFSTEIQDDEQTWQFYQPTISESFVTAVAVNKSCDELNVEIHEA